MTANVSKRLDELSPEKRALLLEKLRQKAQATENAGASSRQDSHPIPRRPDQSAYPLSYAQQRLWILSQLQPDSAFYNVPLALRLCGPLNIPALEESLNEIVARHEVLRASFATERGNPVQVIAPKLTLSLVPEDVPGPDVEAAAQTIATAEARQPFDLVRGPLVRCRLLKLGTEDYLLLLTLHHIVTDAWSTGVLVRELAGLYQVYALSPAALTGRLSLLPPLEIQYADYAAWQREQLQGEKLKAELAFWKEQLRGVPTLLELPTDRPRAAQQSVNGAIFPFELQPELTQRLRRLAHDEGATPYQVLLAAFQVLLHRYTNQDDICVGTPIANRTRLETEGLIGFFVNTLVMRSDFSDNPKFRTVLGRLKERALSAQAHQDVPFEMLVDEIAPQRNLAITPIFQVMFTLEQREAASAFGQGTGFDNAKGSGTAPSAFQRVTITPVETHSATSKFDITLLMTDNSGGRMGGSFEYNVDLFDEVTIQRMCAHFQQVLTAIASHPELPVGSLALLTAAELVQIAAWNDTVAELPRLPLHGFVEEWAESTPGAPAAIFVDGPALAPTGHYTYAELNARANRLAHWLIEQGAGPETLVGIAVERSLDMVVALLATLKAGGAFLPLDPTYPPERLQFMLADSGVRRVLTHAHLLAERPWLQPAGGRAFCLDRDWPLVAGLPDTDPHIPLDGDNLAYVIYTSGSTGRPKGVLVGHRGVANFVGSQTRAFNITQHDRIVQFASFSFDASIAEIFMALTTGAALYLAPRDTLASLVDLRRLLQIHGITTATLPPSLLTVLSPAGLDSLQCLVSAGERLSADVAAKWATGRRLFNAYGPTEATIGPSLGRVTELPAGAMSAPVGRPIANTTIQLCDRYGNPVPVGIPGELCVGGVGVTRGYLGRPELTAERFLPGSSGGRQYRTGDLARFLPDGQIEILGRIDQQVKLRGFRIELGEIQVVLGRHEQVRQAFVMVRQDPPGADERTPSEPRVVAYVVPKDAAAPPTAADLRAHLRQQLPEYMVPSAFVFLEGLPVSPSGKVDRSALPAPDLAKIAAERPYVAPRSPVERFLTEKWQEVLHIEKVSVTDNFFELGGNSLQAAVLTNRMQEELGASAHVRALFMAPTIADLANYLDEYYPDAVARIAGIVPPEPASPGAREGAAAGYTFQEKARVVAIVDDAKVAEFHRIVPPLAACNTTAAEREDRNPPAVFVLSPPRSGSTLLRVMLAGNPRLFAPPELDLMSFNTLAERRAAFSGKYEFWLEGPIKALMELRKCSADEAEAIMARFESEGWTTKRFYRQLQTWISETAPEPGTSRLLVDKTPVYPMDYNILARMEQDFADARYVHLVRHPFATIYSFMEAKLEDIFFRWDHPWTMRELAELVYLVSHRNILKFLERIPPERQHRVWFEEMVGDAPRVMHGICEFLDIDFHPDMLEPYKGDKMTSGTRPGHQMVGDFKFYLRNKIDPKAADRWKRFLKGDVLADQTWDVARQFNYEIPAEEGTPASSAADVSPTQAREPIKPRQPSDKVMLSFAQERLWFLDQFEPGSPFYNVPAAVRLTGEVKIPALRRALTTIVQRHEVLRTTFASVDGVASPVIAERLEVPLPVVDLTALPAEKREAEVLRLAAEEARRPFDLANGPLLRAALLDLGAGPDGHDTVALVTMHHIVSDGWSVNVFIKELATLYAAYHASGDETGAAETQAFSSDGVLPPLPIQYADFAAWQRRWLDGQDLPNGMNGHGSNGRNGGGSPLQGQLAYWKEQLKGLPGILELPTDRPRPAVQTLNGERYTFTLPQELTARIKTLARGEGVTMFMTLLAAFETLLMRYTGQEDIAVGTPIAGRNRPEIANLIGFFVNTLVMRGDLSPAPGAGPLTFRQLLKRVQATAIKAYENQDVPFETLVEVLQPQRDMSHTPLFQAMFALQDAPLQAMRAPGLTLSPLQPDTKTAKFDLMLNVVERTDVLRCALEYNTDLFNPSTAFRMAEHLRVLLEAIVAEPDASITTLPLLTHAEQQMMLVEWNDTSVDTDTDSTLSGRFEAQAKAAPDVDAVVAEVERGGVRVVETVSYGELNRRGDQVARRLAGQGVGPESIVGLMADRSLDLLAGVVGIWKAGAAYVPLDPSYPPDRLAFMLADSGARVLLAQTKHAQTAAISGLSVVLLDADDSNAVQAAVTPAGPDNLAYIIYTSGSTGRPKGVAVTHRTALNLAAALDRVAYAQSRSERPLRVSLNAPLAFDASVQQLVTLTLGHTLVIIPQELRGDAAGMLAFIRRQRLDQLDCVPSQLKLLLAEGLLSPGAEWTPSIVFPGGEAIDEPTWAALATAPRTLFYNMYGPTECTVDSTTISARQSPKRATIGRPVANARVYVLDRNLQPAAIGVPGELFISGAGVSRGYLNRPDLTSERFLPDPFAGEQRAGYVGARMYRTGDRVRWMPDGTLEFLGRMDFQVKVRGFRIELGEIEETLRGHPGVEEAVVLATDAGKGGEAKRLIAYIVPRPGSAASPLTTADLRKHLLATLPDYMVPSAFLLLDAMPLTPNRKIDRGALARLSVEEAVKTETGTEYAAPSGFLEETLAGIYARVLGLDKVGVNDNFFELGGDSILTIQVVARAGQAGINIAPKQIFQAPTVGQLALLAQVKPPAGAQAEQGLVEGDLPLTPIQQRFFETALVEPDHWNQSLLLAVGARLQPSSLREAVAAVLRHHDALRLQFKRVDGEWRQANGGMPSEIPFEHVDLSALDEPERGEALREHILRLQASLSIGRGPLVRIAYFDFGPQTPGRLLTIVHHLAVDRVSWRVLLEDLGASYEQVSQGLTPQLPLKTTSFREWSLRLSEYALLPEVTAEANWWLRLEREPIPPLLPDYPRGSNTEDDVRTTAVFLDEGETESLVQKVGKAYGTEVHEALLTSLALALQRWTGQTRALVEMEGFGRQAELVSHATGVEMNLARTVGWFTSVHPLLLRLPPEIPGQNGLGRALMAVKEEVREAPNGGTGFGLLRYLNRDPHIAAAMRRVPLPQISFNYLGQFIQDTAQAAIGNAAFGPAPESSGPDHAAGNERRYLLDVTASVFEGKLRVEFSYSDAQFAEETIGTLGDLYLGALRSLIEHCLSPEAGGYTKSDFADSGLDEEGVQDLLAELGELDE